MPGRLLVVDASAIAALLFGESKAEEVSRRLGAAGLVAPRLLRYELASVCRKKIERQPSRKNELLRALALLDEMGVREVDVVPEEVVVLASRSRLTTYDASYLWLAKALGAELITLDERLRRATKRLGHKGK